MIAFDVMDPALLCTSLFWEMTDAYGAHLSVQYSCMSHCEGDPPFFQDGLVTPPTLPIQQPCVSIQGFPYQVSSASS